MANAKKNTSVQTVTVSADSLGGAGHGHPRPRGRPPSYPALVVSQNQHRFYFLTIPVGDLFPYCFVSRRDDDPLAGFQRALSEPRAQDIANYLASGRGSIPSNIVLSAQETADLAYNSQTKSISFRRRPNVFLVLDGQHRLWGYHKCRVSHRVPVAIYESLTRAQEAKLFIDINTNQRGVPAALLLDIKQVAQIESQRESIMREFFDRLQNDGDSALAGRLSPSRSVTGRISRVSFNRAVGNALQSGVLLDLEGEQRYRLIKNYINAFDAELKDKQLLSRSAYFEAMFEVFDEVVRNTIALQRNAKQESMQKVIRPLAKLDIESARGGGRGKLTKGAVTALLKAALRTNIAISDDML